MASHRIATAPPGPSYRMSPRITLDGVYAFAKHCPCLRELNMTFDATVVPKIKINATNGVSQHHLSQLNVAYSHIGKSRPVATFLSAIFPQLETIGTLYEELPEAMAAADPQVVASHKGWKKVETALWNV
ncbi:hypothetical protein B0H13DRAFT_279747 [Mycena leptocephala]|nr:hypothetical protein B0H13DRAFT_279747 [Mycena leptocephala]